jgi:hypothetical protein
VCGSLYAIQIIAFWPSIRKLITGHVALAPSMKGTASTLLICPLSDLSGGCQPSVIQQSTASHDITPRVLFFSRGSLD